MWPEAHCHVHDFQAFLTTAYRTSMSRELLRLFKPEMPRTPMPCYFVSAMNVKWRECKAKPLQKFSWENENSQQFSWESHEISFSRENWNVFSWDFLAFMSFSWDFSWVSHEILVSFFSRENWNAFSWESHENVTRFSWAFLGVFSWKLWIWRSMLALNSHEILMRLYHFQEILTRQKFLTRFSWECSGLMRFSWDYHEILMRVSRDSHESLTRFPRSRKQITTYSTFGRKEVAL